jgi:hypothetical protein
MTLCRETTTTVVQGKGRTKGIVAIALDNKGERSSQMHIAIISWVVVIYMA